jgi:transposase
MRESSTWCAGGKTVCGTWGTLQRGYYDRNPRQVRDFPSGGVRIYLRFEARRMACRRCGAVKTERPDWLADNPHFTRRFAFYVGRLCREMTAKRAAALLHLTWDQVKELEKQSVQAILAKAPAVRPRAIGIDEVSRRKGDDYRVLVSDLEAERPIWYGGSGRKEEVLEQVSAWLGPEKTARLELAVMSMWKPFRAATTKQAHPARIIFDKFHVLRHFGEAPDAVRERAYRRVAEEDWAFIKGQKYTLLFARANLTLDGRQALQKLLKANRRLQTAYLLKESFGQLWRYRRAGSARTFFENWRAQLQWQRLPSHEKFAQLIDRHWAGLVAYCHPDNKVSLGFVEGVNNKVRVIQRRAFGLRDEEYLRLKILTAFLPEL